MRRSEDLLDVVDDEGERAGREEPAQPALDRLRAWAGHEPEGCGEDARDELGVMDRLERYEPRPVPVPAGFPPKEFGGKARLSRAARADEGEQPVRAQQSGEFVEVGVPTDEAGQPAAGVAAARATSRLERRELESLAENLVERLGPGDVA